MNSYSFLPWLRRGLAGGIDRIAAGERAAFTVELEITGDPIEPRERPAVQTIRQLVELYGPGDVVGVDRRAVVRVEPRDGTTNFESNFMPFVEFYDEDFPWRYSPANPDDLNRLRPWLALVVLDEDEFAEGSRVPQGPLPFVTVPDLAALPPAEQLHAWAHVHVNGSVTGAATVSDDMPEVLGDLETLLARNPDLASSRLLCPRRLQPGRAYHAFLVPAFESGRLAGLGLDPAGTPELLHSGWVPYDGRPAPDRLCYYHRWFFRTSPAGDFEQLVRLLKPRTVDARVGNRDMDVRRPGADLPGITDPELGGVLRLGGALKVPDTALSDEEQAEAQRFEEWDQPTPHPFQEALARLVNRAADIEENPDGPDPLIAPPLYGRWHALTTRLAADGEDWVHELNLDPRFRVAAGLGAQVVRARQEQFMKAAWDQVGAVIDTNRRVRMGQLAREVGFVYHTTHLVPLRAAAPGRVLALTAPLLGRVVADGVTIAHAVARSRIAQAPLSPVMRRVTRPRSRLMRRLPFTAAASVHALIPRINAGEVVAAAPRTPPTGAVTVEQLEAALAAAPGFVTVFAVADPVDGLPHSDSFRIMRPDVIESGPPPREGGADNDEALNFKAGLRAAYTSLIEADVIGRPVDRAGVELDRVGAAALAELHPDRTIPRRVLACLRVPERFRRQVADDFVEAMTYPVIDLPMYRPLTALSGEFFLPNLGLIPPNSITLLETNQRFVEAYLAGLNHEMARELLWREYPTDQRGTPFRQFWDPGPVLARPGENEDDARERLRDIPPMDRWATGSALGAHDHREAGGDPEDELVLVIRGELLKRYPTAVIYAHRAEWVAGGVRRPVTLTAAEEQNPPPAKVRTPLYEAKVEPDVYFLGFDLTEELARGGTTPAQDPGWFFVIKERPGEPRFGLDVARAGGLEVWNDLSWPDVLRTGDHVDLGQTRTHTLVRPPDTSEKREQHDEDAHVTWHARMNSDELAYICYQAPVLVAVHAREMLRHDGP